MPPPIGERVQEDAIPGRKCPLASPPTPRSLEHFEISSHRNAAKPSCWPSSGACAAARASKLPPEPAGSRGAHAARRCQRGPQMARAGRKTKLNECGHVAGGRQKHLWCRNQRRLARGPTPTSARAGRHSRVDPLRVARDPRVLCKVAVVKLSRAQWPRRARPLRRRRPPRRRRPRTVAPCGLR